VTHDQKDEGISFFETSGIVNFKWLKYKDKNSRFMFFFGGGGGNESCANKIIYLFLSLLLPLTVLDD
jgi:hypothetical protein